MAKRKIQSMSLIKHPRSPFWWVDIQPSVGGRIRRSTGTTDKRAAQKFHDELKASLWKPQSAKDWDKAVTKWLQAGERSKEEAYMLLKLGNLDLANVEAAIQHHKPSTYNRYRSLIVAICNLSKIAIDIPKKKVPKGRTRFLTPQEWGCLVEELPPHLRDIASFALYTGLRQSNVTGLTWDRVDLTRGVIWVDADQMKGGKAHGIPLSDKAIALLKGLMPPEPVKGYVFLYKGKPIKKIKLAWQKACVRSNLGTFTEDEQGKKMYTGFTFHGLRHTWASWKVQNGTPLMVVKELGAWQSLSMVERYAHLAPDHLKQYVNQ